MIEGTQPDVTHAEKSHEDGHPSPLTYAKIAVLLAAITAIEVGIFYVEFLSAVIIPIFLILSGVKFVSTLEHTQDLSCGKCKLSI